MKITLASHCSGDNGTRAHQPAQSHLGTPAMQTITERSSKADIITAAVELTDHQQSQIETLQQRQTILLALLGILAILQLI